MSDAWLTLIADPVPWTRPRPLPLPVETERLVVRCYRRDDGPALYRGIIADRAALLPWMAWARTDHQAESDSIYYVERSRRRMEQPDCIDFPMGMFDRATGELIGGTGLHDIRPGLRQAEIGYWVRGDRHGQGLCTEAIGALASAALTPRDQGGWGLRRLVIYNATANVASRRVCEKLGLRLEMRLRRARYLGPDGPGGGPGYHDVLGFAVLAEEWDVAAQRARPGIGWGGLDPSADG
jgi:RimJ/RimL family protein N-acetyltransferase